MKKFIGVLALVSVLALVTGCEPSDPDRRYNKCVESGGSWLEDAWGQSCVMPERGNGGTQ